MEETDHRSDSRQSDLVTYLTPLMRRFLRDELQNLLNQFTYEEEGWIYISREDNDRFEKWSLISGED